MGSHEQEMTSKSDVRLEAARQVVSRGYKSLKHPRASILMVLVSNRHQRLQPATAPARTRFLQMCHCCSACYTVSRGRLMCLNALNVSPICAHSDLARLPLRSKEMSNSTANLLVRFYFCITCSA